MILSVSTEFFKATALWEKPYGVWSCTRADPEIHWMVGMNRDQAKLAPLKMGAHFEFTSCLTGKQSDNPSEVLTPRPSHPAAQRRDPEAPRTRTVAQKPARQPAMTGTSQSGYPNPVICTGAQKDPLSPIPATP